MAKSILSNMYDKLPRLGQTVALNAFGLRNRRRLRRWNEIVARLEPSERWTRDEQIAYVTKRLGAVLEHAVRFVPRYEPYRKHLGRIEQGGHAALELLEQLPLISKDEVIRRPDEFLSSAFSRETLVRTVTSGTTGTPLSSWLEPRAFLESDALWWRRTAWAGWKPGDWIARLVGDPVIPLDNQNPRQPWRVSWTDRRLYFSTYHLNAIQAQKIVACLARRRPQFLMGYPSAMEALARLTSDRGILESWSPKAILYSSEPLYEHQRAAIAGLTPSPIRGLYGCAERVVSASECEHGSFHLSLVDGYIEGQFGILPTKTPAVVTGLLNLAMPLIRYSLGDVLTPRSDRGCACGRTLPQIDAVVTKSEDTIVTPSGREISPSILTWAFKDLEGVQRSQIVQRDATRLEVLVQTSGSLLGAAATVLKTRIESLTFHEMTVDVTAVPDIEMTAAGKTRFVVNDHCRSGGAR